MAKRAGLEVHQTVAVFSTRVKEPNETDWIFFVIVIKYLCGTKKKCFTLSSDDLKVIKCYVDASFTVHPDFRGRTRAIITMSVSRKQFPGNRN